MKYAAYSEYKTSNIGWIRDFPAHWKLTRLKYVANRAEVKVEADEDNPLPYIGLEQVEPWTGRLIGLDDDLVPTGISNRFEAGDTLFGKLRPYLAKACNVDFDGLCSSELLVLRGKTYNRDFLLYQLLSHGFINLVDSTTYGSKMPRASWDFIGICELPLPPLDEQQTIARFLDAKTAQIDALVAQKRQLIAKLKEKRSALIARTVTRGLPPEAAKAAGLEPNPEMKDSGVDWLGAIPRHWRTTRLKYATNRIIDCPHDTPLYDPAGSYLVVRTADLDSGTLDLSRAYRVDESEYLRRIRRAKIVQNDILYGREGERWGYAALAPKETTICLGQRMMQFQASVRFDSGFLMWHLNARSVYEQGTLDVAGSTAPHVNVETIRNYLLAEPPLGEQTAIAAFIGLQTMQLDRLVAQINEAITRLTEYRQALITSTVTGKIDVRGLA